MDKRPIFQKTPGAGRTAALAAGYGHQVSVDREEAETIALRALGFIAEDEDRIGAFMGETGISPDDLRLSATSPDILAAVLDYITRDESLLLMFATNTDVPPERITPAFMVLNGEAGPADGSSGLPNRPSKIIKRR
jgi:Protein of unknown function (DUF3572)